MPRSTTRNAETSDQVAIEAIRARRDVWLAVIQGGTQVLTVVVTGLPLYAAYGAVAALAGKTTTISATISYGVAAAVGGSTGLAVWGSGRAKSKRQSKELIRLRTRITELENERDG